MKFTDGYWVVKPEMEMHYAAEAYAAKLSPKKLEVLAPCRRISGRGDTLDGGALTVSFTTPLDGVIRVEIVQVGVHSTEIIDECGVIARPLGNVSGLAA